MDVSCQKSEIRQKRGITTNGEKYKLQRKHNNNIDKKLRPKRAQEPNQSVLLRAQNGRVIVEIQNKSVESVY